MPFQLSWYAKNQVILIIDEGQTTDQDMLNIDPQVIDYLNQCKTPLVHVIIDKRKSNYTPPVKVLTALQWPKHPQYGWTILVGLSNPFERFVNVVATTFFKARQRMFDTMDEALAFLNEVDSTLPNLRDIKLDKAS